MTIQTRLNDLLDIQHPVLLAPMDLVSDARMALAVKQGGGFGIIGGGYADEEWLTTQLDLVGDAKVGVGFITWSMEKNIRCLDIALERKPPVLMLSFGSVAPHAEKIKKSGALLVCQVQTLAQAREALQHGTRHLVRYRTKKRLAVSLLRSSFAQRVLPRMVWPREPPYAAT